MSKTKDKIIKDLNLRADNWWILTEQFNKLTGINIKLFFDLKFSYDGKYILDKEKFNEEMKKHGYNEKINMLGFIQDKYGEKASYIYIELCGDNY